MVTTFLKNLKLKENYDIEANQILREKKEHRSLNMDVSNFQGDNWFKKPRQESKSISN